MISLYTFIPQFLVKELVVLFSSRFLLLALSCFHAKTHNRKKKIRQAVGGSEDDHNVFAIACPG